MQPKPSAAAHEQPAPLAPAGQGLRAIAPDLAGFGRTGQARWPRRSPPRPGVKWIRAPAFDRLDPRGTLAGRTGAGAGTPLTRRGRPGLLPGPVPVEHAPAATARPQAGLQTVRPGDQLPVEHAQYWFIGARICRMPPQCRFAQRHCQRTPRRPRAER
jgi:hypothetical protein